MVLKLFKSFIFLNLFKLLGGFAPHPDHDAHIIPTLSAIQILITFNSISESGIDTNKVISCESSIIIFIFIPQY